MRAPRRRVAKDTGLVSYKVQAVVDAQHHLIVAHEVTNIGNDRSQLSMMAKQAQEATSVCELTAIADRVLSRRNPLVYLHKLEHQGRSCCWSAFKPDIVRLIHLRAWSPRRKDQGDNINLRRGSTPDVRT